jgi:hypothetical protein
MHVSEQRTFAGIGNIINIKDLRILLYVLNVLWDKNCVYKIDVEIVTGKKG